MAQKTIALVVVLYAIGVAVSLDTHFTPLFIWLAVAAALGLLLGFGASRYSVGYALRFIFLQSALGVFTLMVLNPLQLPLENRFAYVMTVSHTAVIMWFPWLMFATTGGYLFGGWIMKYREANQKLFRE